MKTYIDRNAGFIQYEGAWIPKDIANSNYSQFLEEQAKGEAVLVPYVPPAPTWEEIKAQRNVHLKDSDWTDLPNTPLSNKQAWQNYRQALRDIPQTFARPEDVIWPEKP